MSSLRPDPGAQQLAERMIEMDDIHRTILSETLESQESGEIMESGRTLCPRSGSVKGPGQRYERSVELAGCPLEKGATWHTHVSPGQLRNPHNSLPDMANVVYGYTDASVVSGTDTAEAIMASADQSKMVAAFQDALGVEAESPGEVYNAVMSGGVNAYKARRRARSALEPLIVSRKTGFPDLRQRVSGVQLLTARGGSAEDVSGCTCHNIHRARNTSIRQEMQNSCEQMTASMQDVGDKASIAGVDIGGLVVSNALGTIVGNVVNKALFD